jgi:predicted Fe-Mo cluster-binding NifX family protein
MRVCLPTLDDRGRDGVLAEHFGSAPYFTLVDSETGQLRVIANRTTDPAPFTCDAVEALGTQDVAAVICLGLGRRALAGLRDSGISVFVTDATRVGKAVEAFRDDRLRSMTEAGACRGGQHRGRHCHPVR